MKDKLKPVLGRTPIFTNAKPAGSVAPAKISGAKPAGSKPPAVRPTAGLASTIPGGTPKRQR